MITTRRVASEGPASLPGDVPYHGELYQPFCDAASSAFDWEDSRELAWEETPGSPDTRWLVPDPEVVRAHETFGNNIVLRPPGGTVATEVRFPPYQLIGESRTTEFYRYLGRCRGFDELWMEVTQGLELPPYIPKFSLLGLADILSPTGSSYGSNGIELTDLIETVSSENDIFWHWKAAAPWYEEPLAWYLVQMLCLLRDSYDLLPDTVVSPRSSGKIPRSVLRSQIQNRVSGVPGGNGPMWRLSVRYFDTYNEAVGAFDIRDCTWGAPNPPVGKTWADLTDALRGETSNGGFVLGTPASIYVSAESVVPRIYGAAQCYSLARLFTMFAARYETALKGKPWTYGIATVFPDAYEGALHLAKLYFKAYLGCFVTPGKTLVHELFHTAEGLPWYTYVEGQRVTEGHWTHCKSGCGQEKMGSAWLMRFAQKYHGAWVTTDGDNHPEKIAFAGDEGFTGDFFGESRCVSEKDNPSGVELHGKGEIFLRWRLMNYGQPDSRLDWSARIEQGEELAEMIAEQEDRLREVGNKVAYHQGVADVLALWIENQEEGLDRWVLSAEKDWHEWRAEVYRQKLDSLREDVDERIEELSAQTRDDFSRDCWNSRQHTGCGGSGSC